MGFFISLEVKKEKSTNGVNVHVSPQDGRQVLTSSHITHRLFWASGGVVLLQLVTKAVAHSRGTEIFKVISFFAI